MRDLPVGLGANLVTTGREVEDITHALVFVSTNHFLFGS